MTYPTTTTPATASYQLTAVEIEELRAIADGGIRTMGGTVEEPRRTLDGLGLVWTTGNSTFATAKGYEVAAI